MSTLAFYACTCEIRLGAERRAGQLLAEMEKARPGPRSLGSDEGSPKLADLGITYDQSSKWQQLAQVPEEGSGGIDISD